MRANTLRNYVGGRWVASGSPNRVDVINPATAEALASVPLSTPAEVDRAARAAAAAFPEWRRGPDCRVGQGPRNGRAAAAPGMA